MEELTKAEKRNQARLYIAKIDDYHLKTTRTSWATA